MSEPVLYIVATAHPFSGGRRLEIFAYMHTEAAAGAEELVTAEAWEAAGEDDPARARALARKLLDCPAGERVREALLEDRDADLADIVRTCGVLIDPDLG